jgi:AraC-like DNA-binding protein
MPSVFEKIDHQRLVPAKIFITQIESSRPHWHYDYELLVVLSGNLRVFSGPQSFIMAAGDIALFNTKEIHGFSNTGSENICLYIQFSPIFFSSILSENQTFFFYLNSVTKIFTPQIPYSAFAASACRIGQVSRSKAPFTRIRIMAFMQTLAADLVEFTEHDIRSVAINAEDGYGDGSFTEISNYIDTHLIDENLACDICKTFHTTPKQIYRYLKNISGFTLKDLIDTARIEKSKHLLRETSTKISVIADMCGFTSETTFFRVFRKETGKTPYDYRHGLDSLPSSGDVRGYLRFSEDKAHRLLEEFASLGCSKIPPSL